MSEIIMRVYINYISWTPYDGGGTNPPELVFNPADTAVQIQYDHLLSVDVSATEPDGDSIALWAAAVPSGATFPGATGDAPVEATFSWTPALSQTGDYAVVFHGDDKDGADSKTLNITVLGDVSYYHNAIGKTGEELRVALHDIISSGVHQMSDPEEDEAMRELHSDPANSNHVILLYSRLSMAKSLYNATNGWNKEHVWPTSRGLGSSGADENDAHNLFAADKLLNANRGNLYFDESDPGDAGYQQPAATNAPDASFDSDSWEPPPEVKGDVARALFYMAVRYDGSEENTMNIRLTDIQMPPASNRMGILSCLLAWHADDPPDAWESNRNETIYQTYQTNRNPFIDHPEWADSIWGTNRQNDTDGDGLPDDWEEQYFGSPTAARTTNDDDTDSFDNWQEYIAGSDPTNRASYLDAHISLAPENLDITSDAVTTGRIYHLDSADPAPGHLVWLLVATTNDLDSGQLRFTLPITNTRSLYRIRARLP